MYETQHVRLLEARFRNTCKKANVESEKVNYNFSYINFAVANTNTTHTKHTQQRGLANYQRAFAQICRQGSAIWYYCARQASCTLLCFLFFTTQILAECPIIFYKRDSRQGLRPLPVHLNDTRMASWPVGPALIC